MRARWLVVMLGGLVLWGPVRAELPGGASGQLDQLLGEGRRQLKAEFSVHIRDLDSGRTLWAHEPDRALVPASNMKLVTTAAALEQLGADFVYETRIGLLGDSLAVFGAGDPLTGDPVLAEAAGTTIMAVFDAVVERLRERGVTRLRGDLLVDDTIFDDERFHPSWPADQRNQWYTAQVSGLNFNDNCLDVLVRPAAQAQAAPVYELTPTTGYVQITNHCTTVTSKNGPWAVRSAEGNAITLMGRCARETEFEVTIDRPSAYFGYVLAERLLAEKVRIDGRLVIRRLRDAQGRLPEGFEELLVWRTPLADVLARCNQRSLNLAAECLFKTLGARASRPPGGLLGQGSWATGRQAVGRFLRELGVDTDNVVIDDGSGLSDKNRLTARTLTTVLGAMAQRPGGEMFRASLARPGAGTLRRRFSGAGDADRLQAKTGYISGAWALSGYCQTADGQWLAFSILANSKSGRSCRVLIDKLVMALMQ